MIKWDKPCYKCLSHFCDLSCKEPKHLQAPQPKEPEQKPVAMRMPKVGDKVVCIEDDSLGVVAYLTAGGSPEIMFDDGSHGTYLLREFAELFRYTTPQSTWQGLTDEHPLMVFAKECVLGAYQETELADAAKRAIEQARGIKE